ncbi:extracellular solute-binding protein [Paenibacillus cremeus]|uniref:Extracellular solute-binding protein n=1 Tax=Paenibacillus cremeus TaxID=2163881 RepID=A0A559KI49_9BACL|nr:extracellular solute-binding protein [Paenibacillus cremeus]TVY11748.1 extracellular solute-binding protein [Paenibacillus cremeus]
MKNVRKTAMLTAAVLLAGSAAGCSNNAAPAGSTGSAGTSSTSSAPQAPVELSVMFYTSANIQISHDNNEAIKFLEKKFNVKLNVMDIPINDYTTKQNTIVASGSMPDVMVWNAFPEAALAGYIKQGAFMQLDKYIDAAPNLKKYPQAIWDNVKTDGHFYIIPRVRPLVRTGVYIRKDWLDKLGLPIPKTTDDLAKVAIAFAQNDPDGDGKANTYGIVTDAKMGNLNPIFAAFGAGNGWLKGSDGSLVNSYITPGTNQALQYLRNLYEKGGLSKDFAVQQGNARKEIQSGKAGIMVESYIVDYAQDIAALKKVDPKAELVYIDPPVGPSGVSGYYAGSGNAGGWVVPATTKPEKVKKLMEIMDWEASDEGYKFNKYGLDGIHSTKAADGTIATNEKYISDDIKELIMVSPYDVYSYTDGGAPADIQKIQRDALDKIKDKGIANPVPNFISPTQIQKNEDLNNKLRYDYFIRIITGQLPTSAFDEFVSKWKSGGGDQITKETNDFVKGAK